LNNATRRVAAGAGWLYTYRWAERLLDGVALVVLARILAPSDFGLVAIAASLVTIVEGFAAFDVNRALIRTRDDDRALYDTAWTLSALRGFAASLVMLMVASFVTDARLGPVVVALAASPLLSGMANPRFVTFERDLVYSKLAVSSLGAKVVSVGVSVLIAVLYRSYWALVLGMLAAHLVTTILSYVLKPYRPSISLARFSTIFGFSGWLSLATIATTLSMETDKIIVGRLVGIVDAGRYFMTQRIGVVPTRELISPLQRVLFPSFSALIHDKTRDRLRRVVRESINVLGSLSLPAGFGFALVANDFVPLVLGERWVEIVPLLTILVPYLGVRATVSMTLPCVMALGETRQLFWVSLGYAFVHLPVFVAGTALFGLVGSIWGIVTAGALYVYLNAWLLKRNLDISIGDIGSQLRRPIVAAIVMVGTVLGVSAFTPLELFGESASWPSLWIKVLIGGAAFVAVQVALWRLEGRPAGIERRLLQLLTR
jgi:PST family polysaccharide transporter